MITKERMKAYVEANEHLISVKKQAPNTTVLKYKNKVFYKNLWTPELCELRGTVVDDNFDIVQRSFTKIFNVGEDKAPKIHRDSPVTAPEKVNGFMGVATIRDDELFISTTGSIASDFADLARKHIVMLDWRRMNPELSYTFEICDESDQHIVPEKFGAHLLGVRYKEWEAAQHAVSEMELDEIAADLGALRPAWQRYDTFQELKDKVRTVNHEGFVIWDDFGNEVKIKSPYYLATKFFGRKTPERLEKLLDDPREAKRIIDEEYYVAIDYLAERKDEFLEMNEWDRMTFLRDFFDREVLK
jgi:tRNA splicing ligase